MNSVYQSHEVLNILKKLEIFWFKKECAHTNKLLCTCKLKNTVITLNNKSLSQTVLNFFYFVLNF